MKRGRAFTSASTRGASPLTNTTIGEVSRSAVNQDGNGLERKPSASYGHHRQTSIVHGLHHSRNTSYVNSPATSPLSPQVIAATAIAGSPAVDGSRMAPEEAADLSTLGDTSKQEGPPPTANGDRAIVDGNTTAAQRRPERMHSGRIRPVHRSRSRQQHHHQQQQQELNTVGEYALHHLFNSVGLHGV